MCKHELQNDKIDQLKTELGDILLRSLDQKLHLECLVTLGILAGGMVANIRAETKNPDAVDDLFAHSFASGASKMHEIKDSIK